MQTVTNIVFYSIWALAIRMRSIQLYPNSHWSLLRLIDLNVTVSPLDSTSRKVNLGRENIPFFFISSLITSLPSSWISYKFSILSFHCSSLTKHSSTSFGVNNVLKRRWALKIDLSLTIILPEEKFFFSEKP